MQIVMGKLSDPEQDGARAFQCAIIAEIDRRISSMNAQAFRNKTMTAKKLQQARIDELAVLRGFIHKVQFTNS